MAATDVIEGMLSRVVAVADGLSRGELIGRVLSNHATEIEDLQREQLFAGRASSGEDIRPYYSEDVKPAGYFKSRESAARYAAWKQNAVPYPVTVQRNPDAPNLYVDGTFHSELAADLGTDGVAIVGTTAYAQQIIAKYGIDTFGLTTENWERIFREYGVLDEVIARVRETLNL